MIDKDDDRSSDSERTLALDIDTEKFDIINFDPDGKPSNKNGGDGILFNFAEKLAIVRLGWPSREIRV